MVEELVCCHVLSWHPRLITCQSDAVVSSIEYAHYVLIFDQNEQNAIKLQATIAESWRHIKGNNEPILAQCSGIK